MRKASVSIQGRAARLTRTRHGDRDRNLPLLNLLDAGVAVVAGSAVYWLESGISAFFGYRRVPGLRSVDPLPESSLPTLAIVATAKDEAARVESAARSLLAQDYPGLSLVIVDDRSMDGTGAILDRLALEDPRLRVVHIDALPYGWVGKCYALARGAEATDSEWILFVDADVTLEPDAARRAVSLASRDGWDHVAVGPDMRLESLGEEIFVAAFMVVFDTSQRPWRASNPRRRNAIGIGAFNLVRRESYRRAGGHEALRYELIDDMALGKILKQKGGARQTFARHDGLVSVHWHPGIRGLIHGVEKNAFPGLRYNVPLGLIAPWLLLVVSWAPVFGFLLGSPAAWALSLLAWCGVLLCYREVERSVNIKAWHVVTMPVGVTLFLYAFVRSMALTLIRGGVVWRGTFYPLEELKRGRVW